MYIICGNQTDNLLLILTETWRYDQIQHLMRTIYESLQCGKLGYEELNKEMYEKEKKTSK